jgi:hypothetical protein
MLDQPPIRSPTRAFFMAICLERYMKKDLSSAAHGMIKRKWLACWKERLGHPDLTPRQVMRLYVKQLNITVARLGNEMDWDVWDEDEYPAIINNAVDE